MFKIRFISSFVTNACCLMLLAQRESSSFGEEEKPITGLLDGNGEYTLTYEDNEGDKMLVGDVPWQ